MAAISPPTTAPPRLRNRFAIETYFNYRGYVPWKPQGQSMVDLVNIAGVLGEYINLLPLSIRQIYYRLAAKYPRRYPKEYKTYEKIGNRVGRARRGLYDFVDPRLPGARKLMFDVIRDDKYVYSQPFFYRDANGFFAQVRGQARALRLDRQKGQPRVMVIWCEAKGMIPMLERIAHPFGIPVITSGGMDSLTIKYQMGLLWEATGRPITVLYIGDHDPSGCDMTLALAEDLISFAGRDIEIEFIRLAITSAQTQTAGTTPDGRPGPLLSGFVKPKKNEENGYNKMLIHMSTSGEYLTYTPSTNVVQVPQWIGDLRYPPGNEAYRRYKEALDRFSLGLPIGQLFKTEYWLFARVDDSASWEAEALDPAQFDRLVRDAIHDRLDPVAFDAAIMEEIRVRGEVLDELPPDTLDARLAAANTAAAADYPDEDDPDDDGADDDPDEPDPKDGDEQLFEEEYTLTEEDEELLARLRRVGLTIPIWSRIPAISPHHAVHCAGGTNRFPGLLEAQCSTDAHDCVVVQFAVLNQQ